MLVSSYRKSLWIRNILLVFFVIGLLASFWKIGWSVYKMSLYEKARKYYEASNLLLAEETYARAHEISSIRYGDEVWSQSLSALTTIRLELEALSRKAAAASQTGDDAGMLSVYESYHALVKKVEQQQVAESSSFFQKISSRLALEKQVDDYFLQVKEQAKSGLEQNLAKKRYQDEHFFATLLAIPDEFYGDAEKKNRELTRLFRSYDQAKFKDWTDSADFSEVVASTADSLRTYKRLNLQADWLVSLLEGYAAKELRSVIRQDDVEAFVSLAKSYRQIQDVLPRNSGTLDDIDRHLRTRMRQAEQYAAKQDYDKAIELYRQLSPLQDTTTYIAAVESNWADQEPTRLLREKYPEKSFRFVRSGEELWRTEVYAIGLSDEDNPILYLAAKMPDGEVRYLEHPIRTAGKPVRLSLSEELGQKEAPLILLEAKGRERAYQYVGYRVDMLRSALVKRFEIEGDRFSAESPEEIIIGNPAGEEEKTIASYRLEEEGLVYAGKLDEGIPDWNNAEQDPPSEAGNDERPRDAQQNSPSDQNSDHAQAEGGTDKTGSSTPYVPAEGPPPDIVNQTEPNTITMYAGPGQQYGEVGQIPWPAKGSVKVVAEADGWFQVQYEGKKGWINRVP
ncbi:SH3 domain-containing protein [Brevibacillus ruminantium]|uniref:SH3 domain-containing protein n=1 Tax=Brevibacillus ruminantium TaxID=2950604 RepID=A0ABY4WIA4_9BACL|nr:SH3 domain-containing protein [Brevibacillus ruminantium]USG65575.1 SH3 domain-containing protein [Brevibacillus ruminantium]